MESRPPVLAICGPTAVGKTAVAVELGRLLDAEIVCADSRQVYQGLEIGSAAPTPAERLAAPHHLVGFLPPEASFSVAEFRDAAEAVLQDIHRRGRLPILVAGTGLYLSTLVEGWSLTGVAADPAVRRRLETEPAGQLWERLRAVDPETAARLAPADRKRVVRALEVWEVTGEPLSRHHREAGHRPVPFEYRVVGLTRDRAELYRRIEDRVGAMVAHGWVAEVESLLARGLRHDSQALEGLGYRRIAAALAGELALEAAVALTKQDTRRFAKRQMTWFRRLAEVTWLELGATETAAATAARLATWWRSGGRRVVAP